MEPVIEKTIIDFSLDLFQKTLQAEENMMISPLSVMIALGMVTAGAEGSTKSELLAALKGGDDAEAFHEALTGYVRSLPSNDKTTFKFADAVFVNKILNLNKQFEKKTEALYDASIDRLYFDEKAVKKINKWVEKATDKMIPTIIDSMVPEAMMYLINALAFNGEWEKPYDAYNVEKTEFTASSGEMREIDGMYAEERIFLHNDACKGFLKPYAGGKYGFLALLPNEGQDLGKFISDLTPETYIALLSGAQAKKVDTMIPKFSMDYASIMNETLKKMGIQESFLPGADFSAMSPDPIVIGDVIHKTHIEVDERGTKAAAVTAVMMKALGLPEPKPSVILDRPFVFAVIDNSCMVPLFIGTVADIGDALEEE